MSRRVDPRKTELLKLLGIEDSKKNWSKKELEERFSRLGEKKKKEEEMKAKADLIAGEIPDLPAAQLPIQFEALDRKEDPFNGLTERQKLIARLRMRGLSQDAIANVVGVSQPMICKELAVIKQWQIERGRNVDQGEIVGSTASLYEEVEYRAWELYHGTQESAEKSKALAVVMQAREKHTKLLMDLGLIKKAGQEVHHKIEVSPFIERWKSGEGKKSLGDAIVVRQLGSLQEPTLDTGVEDAEVVEEEEREDSAAARIFRNDDLAEPTPDDSEDLVLDD